MVPSGFTMASTVAVWLMMTAEWSENVTCTSPSGRTTKRTRLGDRAMAAVGSLFGGKGFIQRTVRTKGGPWIRSKEDKCEGPSIAELRNVLVV